MIDKCNHSTCKYDVYQDDKCIFHCEKTIENEWIIDSDDKYTKWNNKVEKFWKDFIELKPSAENLIIPYYHSNLAENDHDVDIRFKKLEFRSCIFVDEFYLKANILNSEMKEFLIYKCTFKSLYLYDFKLNYLSLLHISSLNIVLQDMKIKKSEICNVKAKKLNLIQIRSSNLIEIWKFNDVNLKLYIENCIFNDLELKELDILDIKFEYNNIFKNKTKLMNIKAKSLLLNNIDFDENSKVLFENIEINSFAINQLSQDSKYIQLNHIKVKEKLNFYKVEFHNSYFNDCDFSKASITLGKLTFVNAYLNSINWGNKNKIITSREIFRDLKASYDNIKNYIEANNFFVMEMKGYKKELRSKSLISHWQEKFVFLLNEKISNFSQSWFLPLLWIILSSQFLFILSKLSNIFLVSTFFFISISGWILGRFLYEKYSLYTMQHIFVIISFVVFISFILNENWLNVLHFSYIQSWNTFCKLNLNVSFLYWLFHKMVLSFLIYHFVIALRRQTRR